MRGCNFGAYFSSNGSTLIAAERTGNMTLQPDSIVMSVIYDKETNKASGVHVRDATTGEETEYYAKVIFLCASTLNTAWIMMNSVSDRFPNGFGNDSDQVGRNVMDHHFMAGARADVEDELVVAEDLAVTLTFADGSLATLSLRPSAAFLAS